MRWVSITTEWVATICCRISRTRSAAGVGDSVVAADAAAVVAAVAPDGGTLTTGAGAAGAGTASAAGRAASVFPGAGAQGRKEIGVPSKAMTSASARVGSAGMTGSSGGTDGTGADGTAGRGVPGPAGAPGAVAAAGGTERAAPECVVPAVGAGVPGAERAAGAVEVPTDAVAARGEPAPGVAAPGCAAAVDATGTGAVCAAADGARCAAAAPADAAAEAPGAVAAIPRATRAGTGSPPPTRKRVERAERTVASGVPSRGVRSSSRPLPTSRATSWATDFVAGTPRRSTDTETCSASPSVSRTHREQVEPGPTSMK